MEPADSQELAQFYEMAIKLREASFHLTDTEREEVAKCVLQAEVLFRRAYRIQSAISWLAIFLLVIAVASVLITWAADYSVPVLAVGSTGVVALFGLGIKAKADNDVSRAKTELEKTIHRLEYLGRG